MFHLSLELIASFIFIFHFLLSEWKAEGITETNFYNFTSHVKHIPSIILQVFTEITGYASLCEQILRDMIRLFYLKKKTLGRFFT